MRLAIDVALVVTYVALMATAVVQEVPHEYLGVVLFVLFGAHVAVNRRWFMSVMRGRYDVLRVLRALAIAGSLASTIALVVSSNV